MLAGVAMAQDLRVSPEVALEFSGFPENPQFPGQRDGAVGALIATGDVTWRRGDRNWQAVIEPYLRYDSWDSDRSYGDLRRAYLRYFGDGWTTCSAIWAGPVGISDRSPNIIYDDRDQARSPVTPFYDDVFLGTRITWDDIDDTELWAVAILDVNGGGARYRLGYQRGLFEQKLLGLELRAIDAQDDPLLRAAERDSRLLIRWTRFFEPGVAT
ncbi:hypothetical protein [Dinoroseobacter sp. S375]|uniref:hypothetical protein n=1 Tax=Dinoroseobacter sp. S375 TaxID=3415136 RepID=UPI003C7EC567